MQIVNKRVDELIPYANNPRDNAGAVDAVAASIDEFGFKVPIVIDKDGVIVAGHTRTLAAEKLGLETVPCIVADDLTDEQIKAFRLADNKTAELASWDFTKLEQELAELSEVDMEQFGFEFEQLAQDDTLYSGKTEIPQYEPNEVQWKTSELCDLKKYRDLIDEIDNSDISETDKMFLKLAASRHIVFYYGKIADYYAKADRDIQELMERSALSTRSEVR